MFGPAMPHRGPVIAAILGLLWFSALHAQSDVPAAAHRGKQAMAEGRFADAAAIYAEVVRALPTDAGMRLNLGMALSMAGRVREAMPHLQDAVKMQPALLPAWLFLGSNWLELGQPSKAVPALRKVVAGDPGNTIARALLGEALLAVEQYEGAAVEFRAVTEQQPAGARGWYGLGRSSEALARAAFAALERRDAESAYVLAVRADALAASQQFGRAIELYREALELRPDLRPARAALAIMYGQAGDEQAVATEREILRRGTPDCPAPASTTSGRERVLECEFLAGRYVSVVRIAKTSQTTESQYWLTLAYNEIARNAFDRLSSLPASAELHQFRADLHGNQGRHLDAVEELRKALGMVPDEPGLTKKLATSLYLAKSYEEALKVLERVAQRDSSPDVLFLLGDTLLLVGRSGDAVRILEQAVAAEPTSLAARASLGRAYLQSGNAAAAVPHLELALKTDEDGSLHYQLARAYQATGRPELAKQTLEKYAAIQKARRR
jgi:tetratricopeptide (TPR) repeat protein